MHGQAPLPQLSLDMSGVHTRLILALVVGLGLHYVGAGPLQESGRFNVIFSMYVVNGFTLRLVVLKCGII